MAIPTVGGTPEGTLKMDRIRKNFGFGCMRLPMQGADIGIPMLAMHSARELADMRDYQALVMFLKIFSA